MNRYFADLTWQFWPGKLRPVDKKTYPHEEVVFGEGVKLTMILENGFAAD